MGLMNSKSHHVVTFLQEGVDEGVVDAALGLPAEQGRDGDEAWQDPDGDDHDKNLGRGPLQCCQKKIQYFVSRSVIWQFRLNQFTK